MEKKLHNANYRTASNSILILIYEAAPITAQPFYGEGPIQEAEQIAYDYHDDVKQVLCSIIEL